MSGVVVDAVCTADSEAGRADDREADPQGVGPGGCSVGALHMTANILVP